MNELMIPALEMTSKEIAELTGKEHRNVLRDIDVLLETLDSNLSNGFIPSTYESGDPPRAYRMYRLDRDATLCLVAGYDANARMRIIKRWQELEEHVRLAAPAALFALPEPPKISTRTLARISGRLHHKVLQRTRRMLAKEYRLEPNSFTSAHAALRIYRALIPQYQRLGVDVRLGDLGFVEEILLDGPHRTKLMSEFPAPIQVQIQKYVDTMIGAWQHDQHLLAEAWYRGLPGPSQPRLAPPRT